MRKTINYGLVLYDIEDKMNITAPENSLNSTMEKIDETLKEKATIKDMENYIEEHKDELKGADGINGKDGYTPIKGVDYFDGINGVDGYTPIKGVDYFDGEDGIDGKDYVLTETDKEDISKLVEVNIPTKVSQLENDNNYLDSIPLEYVTETELTEKGYATEIFVANKIAEAELSGSDVDLSGYATKDEVNAKVDKVKGKSLIDDTEITRLASVDNYDDTELKNLLNTKANKTELHSHSNKTILDNITAENIEDWNNKSEFDGDYNSLTNKPAIPTVPTNISAFTNDSGYLTKIPSEYITETELNNKGYLTEHQDLSSYAKTTDIPTKVSELTNDKGYLTSIPNEYVTETELNSAISGKANSSDIPTKVSELTNDTGFITGYTESDPTVPTHVKSIKETDISNWNSKSTFSGNYNDLTNKPTIPTKTSQLTNDSGYLKSVPSEYITETEMESFYTEHKSELKGDTGAPGSTGKDGVGISSVTQTTTSTADGGTNVITVTKTDGTTSTFSVKNGSKGSTGANGKDGSDANVTEQNITNALGYKPVEPFSVWENIESEVITGKVITRTGYVNTSSQGKYIKVRIDNYSSLKITGYQWDTNYNYAFCTFLNESDSTISYVTLTTGTQYTNYEVAVPSGAVSVLVNGINNNALGVSGLKVYDFKTLSEEKANRIEKWVVPTIEIKDKTIISANGKSEQSQPDGELGIVDVSGAKKVNVIGYQYDLSYGFDVCCFYDSAGTLISQHQGTTSASKTALTLDVPANATTLKVTGQRYSAHVSVELYQVFDVEDLYETLRPNGKKLITLGDSITALGTGYTGWVKYFIEKTGCQLIANTAVNGATLHDKSGTTYDGNPVFNGSDNNVNNVLGNQVQKIINNNYEAPDIIMIAIGTNDGISITKEQMKNVYYDSNNALIPLENVDRTTSAGAYRWCLDKLHETYPNAIIFWCTPIHGFQTTRSAENIMDYAESLRIATEYTGQIMIDTIRCGINGINELKNANGQYLVDGLHPNVNGAKKIGYYNASKVLPYIGNNFNLQ